MPTISMFYGIIIRMFAEKGGKHRQPHIHAIFGDNEVVLSFDGEQLAGSFPSGKMKLLQAWVEIHREDLEANWKLLSENEPAFKIEPLK